MKTLGPRQQKFVDAYLVEPHATKAAIEAGYAKKWAGSNADKLLKNTKIAAEIARVREKISKETEVDALWVRKNLKKVCERCMQVEPVLDKDGNETGQYKFDASGANRSLELLGKHVDVKAFDKEAAPNAGVFNLIVNEKDMML